MKSFCRVFQISTGECFAYLSMTNQIVTIPFLWFAEGEEAVYERLAGCENLQSESFSHISMGLEFQDYVKRLDGYIPGLTLEVTQQCNLRCSYCVYSGNYTDRREHRNVHMDFARVKKCIDFYAHHSRCKDEAKISFYGGEALLEFELIKQAMDYAKTIFCNKSLRFSISTNGLLLKKEIAEWLSQHPEADVVLTLNGPYHDLYRVTKEGKGSFAAIMKNLDRIKKHYPDVWEKQIQLICNVSGYEQLAGMREFYLKEIGRPPMIITGIIDMNGNEKIQSILEAGKKAKQYDKAWLQERYCLENDEFLHKYFKMRLLDIHERPLFLNSEPGYTASCLPFLDKLFIHADGNFNVCEKAAPMSLGNVDDGFDMKAIEKLYMNFSKVLNEKCCSCWAQRLCSVCYKDVDGIMTEHPDISDCVCSQVKDGVLEYLKFYCELAYNYPEVYKRYDT